MQQPVRTPHHAQHDRQHQPLQIVDGKQRDRPLGIQKCPLVALQVPVGLGASQMQRQRKGTLYVSDEEMGEGR